ncbi:hypothetical protein [Desulfobulbus elongatus]|uniref:hypothetical protein n=1 Tax=Desulfobulbus elongatus TaxID=53332 RepID=UPI00048229B1|nr:hypothetical protein [Desulfobulbus elongatus]
MSEYVTRVLLEVNGQNIEDFSSVTEGEYETAKPIKLMNATGFGATTPRYQVEVDYVVPSDKPEFDFTAVKNGTLTIDKMNGVRVTYTGVYCLKVGQTKYEQESEGTTRTITLGARGMTQ